MEVDLERSPLSKDEVGQRGRGETSRPWNRHSGFGAPSTSGDGSSTVRRGVEGAQQRPKLGRSCSTGPGGQVRAAREISLQSHERLQVTPSPSELTFVNLRGILARLRGIPELVRSDRAARRLSEPAWITLVEKELIDSE